MYTLAADSRISYSLEINPSTADSSCYIWPEDGSVIEVHRKSKGDLINPDNLHLLIQKAKSKISILTQFDLVMIDLLF